VVVTVNRRGGLCSTRGACGTTTSDKESVEFELLRTSGRTGLILRLALGGSQQQSGFGEQVMVCGKGLSPLKWP
jgi:hypothetical protein